MQGVCQEDSFRELQTESESCFEMSEVNTCVQLEQENDYQQLESEEDSRDTISEDSCLEAPAAPTTQEEFTQQCQESLGHNQLRSIEGSQQPLKEVESGMPFPAVQQSSMRNTHQVESISALDWDVPGHFVRALQWQARTADSKIMLDPTDVQRALRAHPILNQLSKDVVELKEFIQQGLEDIHRQVRNQNCAEVKEEMSTKPLLLTHVNVKCNGCIAFSIRGKRWKCLQCPDFNLCHKCEKKVTHEHPMLRFNDPLPNDMVERIWTLHNLRDQVATRHFPELMNCILRNAAKLDYSPELHGAFVEKYHSVDFGEFMANVYEIFF